MNEVVDVVTYLNNLSILPLYEPALDSQDGMLNAQLIQSDADSPPVQFTTVQSRATLALAVLQVVAPRPVDGSASSATRVDLDVVVRVVKVEVQDVKET